METSIFYNRGFAPHKWSNLAFGEASSIEEYAFLFGFSAMLRPRRVLEIGTSSGLGTAAVIMGGAMTGYPVSVTTIDINPNPQKAENIEKLIGNLENIHFLTGTSHEQLKILCQKNLNFDLCLIDGGHDVDTVSDDWHYCKKLSGYFLFHDSDSQEGVKQIIEEIKCDDLFEAVSLSYPPGHQIDDPTGEWYKTLTSPGFTIIRKKEGSHAG